VFDADHERRRKEQLKRIFERTAEQVFKKKLNIELYKKWLSVLGRVYSQCLLPVRNILLTSVGHQLQSCGCLKCKNDLHQTGWSSSNALDIYL
jgi:hypothetical protein